MVCHSFGNVPLNLLLDKSIPVTWVMVCHSFGNVPVSSFVSKSSTVSSVHSLKTAGKGPAKWHPASATKVIMPAVWLHTTRRHCPSSHPHGSLYEFAQHVHRPSRPPVALNNVCHANNWPGFSPSDAFPRTRPAPARRRRTRPQHHVAHRLILVDSHKPHAQTPTLRPRPAPRRTTPSPGPRPPDLPSPVLPPVDPLYTPPTPPISTERPRPVRSLIDAHACP